MARRKNKNKDFEDDFDIEETDLQSVNLNEKEVVSKESSDPRTLNLKEIIAPTAFERGASDYIKVGNMFARTYYVESFPEYVDIAYLSTLYDEDFDVDVSLSVKPRRQDKARKELQDAQTILQAELEDEIKSGGNRNRDVKKHEIEKIKQQLADLVENTQKAFEVQLFFTLYASSKEELERNSSSILQSLLADEITAYPFALRQDTAWKTVVPYGIDYVNDKKRNFNTGAVAASIPFYLPELYDELGVYLGRNVFTDTPALIDLYKKGIQNSNLNIFGSSGSGKSTLVKVLTMRSVLHGIKTVIIDPEREYEALTKKMHGGYIRLTSDVKNSRMMNIFDIEEEEDIDSDGNIVKTLDLRSKYEDVAGFISAAYPEITKGQEAQVLTTVRQLYSNFGFIDGKVESLYYNDDMIVSDQGTLINSSYKKTVPKLSDFLDLMDVGIRDGSTYELKDVFDALQPYRHNSSRGMFDTYTPDDLKKMQDLPIITFDVSALEANDTRAVAMYVLLSWIWEKFGKKNPDVKKRILVDEAWMMMSPNMKGSEYTGSFLENMSRRIRKRNGSLTVATQKIEDFSSSQKGSAIITNAHTTFLLSHEASERNVIKKEFDLDDGVVSNIIEASLGRILIKQSSQLYLVDVVLFDEEVLVSTGNNV